MLPSDTTPQHHPLRTPSFSRWPLYKSKRPPSQRLAIRAAWALVIATIAAIVGYIVWAALSPSPIVTQREHVQAMLNDHSAQLCTRTEAEMAANVGPDVVIEIHQQEPVDGRLLLSYTYSLKLVGRNKLARADVSDSEVFQRDMQADLSGELLAWTLYGRVDCGEAPASNDVPST